MKGKLKVMGAIETLEPDGDTFKVNYGFLIEFDSAEDIRQALKDGKCEFEFGD